MLRCSHDDMFGLFDRTPSCDRQTDRRTHGHTIYRARIASRGKMDHVTRIMFTWGWLVIPSPLLAMPYLRIPINFEDFSFSRSKGMKEYPKRKIWVIWSNSVSKFINIVAHNNARFLKLWWMVRVTEGHEQCHRSIERIWLPIHVPAQFINI